MKHRAKFLGAGRLRDSPAKTTALQLATYLPEKQNLPEMPKAPAHSEAQLQSTALPD